MSQVRINGEQNQYHATSDLSARSHSSQTYLIISFRGICIDTDNFLCSTALLCIGNCVAFLWGDCQLGCDMIAKQANRAQVVGGYNLSWAILGLAANAASACLGGGHSCLLI